MHRWSQLSPVPAQPLPEVLQNIAIPVGLCGSNNASCQGHAQISHVPVSYRHGLAPTDSVGNYGPVTAADIARPVCPPAISGDLGSMFGAVNRFTSPANPVAAVNPLYPRAIDPRLGISIAPQWGVTNVVDVPANYRRRINVPYIRRTKTGRKAPVSAPPQAFEDNPNALAVRLINEGADPEAVDIMLRWIFAFEVTEEALRAPIESRELSLQHGGIKAMWQMLLQMTEAVSGEQNYCCRLCPLEYRPEYKNEVDVLRHFKRDHFGFSVACQCW
jgi:hypothetical protein